MRGHLSIMLAAASAFFCVSADAQVLFQEKFSGKISPAWTILHPDTGYYTVKPDELDLRVSRQDIDTGWNNDAKNLFLIANPGSGDFAVTLKINSFIPANNNHAQIDVIALDNEDNLVRANYGFILGQRQAEFGTEMRANWLPRQTPLDLGDGVFFLRLTKIGNSYSQSCSTDGTWFTTLNTPRSFGNGSPAYLGFCAGADPSDASHVHIDSFTVEAIPASPVAVATPTVTAPPPTSVTQKPPIKFIARGTASAINPTVTPTVASAPDLVSDSAVTLSIAAAVQITWPSVLNKSYQVQSTVGISPPNWTNYGDLVVGNGANVSVFDGAGANNQKYYRVLTSQ